MKKPSYLDTVAAYFRARPYQWIDGLELARIGGAYASRSRVAEARTQRGMDISNRIRKVGDRVVSEYRFNPDTQPADDADLKERIDERAAIMEFEGNMLRIHADPLAEAAESARQVMFQQGKARD